MKILIWIWQWIKLPFWIVGYLSYETWENFRCWRKNLRTMWWTQEQKERAHIAILAACTGGAGIKDGKMTIIVERDKQDDKLPNNK